MSRPQVKTPGQFENLHEIESPCRLMSIQNNHDGPKSPTAQGMVNLVFPRNLGPTTLQGMSTYRFRVRVGRICRLFGAASFDLEPDISSWGYREGL